MDNVDLQRLTDMVAVLEHQRNVMTNQLAHAEVQIIQLRREVAAMNAAQIKTDGSGETEGRA